MNDETTRIAERYGITEKCASLERDLLSIDGVTSVEFDLNGFLDDIHQVIVLVGYDFHIVTRKLRLAVDVVNTAYLHGLEESGDRIEDYRKMQADAKAFGAELLTEESIFIDDDHLDCVWYGGHIGGLRYKGYEVSVEVHGDVEITGFMNGHDFLYKNKQNTGAMNMAASDTLRTTFKSDAELWDALNADEEAENKVAFENNSWIEAFVKDPKGHWHGSSVVDDADDALDACGGISGWIDWLNENYIKEDKA